jgi:hypothetical protein
VPLVGEATARVTATGVARIGAEAFALATDLARLFFDIEESKTANKMTATRNRGLGIRVFKIKL